MMSSKTTIIANEVDECAHLRAFKDFLRQLTGGDTGGHNPSGVPEMRNCMARSANETYIVSASELQAEIIMALWTHLQLKGCPRQFQLPLLRTVAAEVAHQCRSAKKCDLMCAITNEVTGKPMETQFDLVKLQKFAVNNLERLLTRLTDNTEAANLQNYAETGALCEGSPCRCTDESLATPKYVAGQIKNKPRKMEDRHLCLERFSDVYQLKRPYSFYAVFDGHSGSLAATYSISQLPYLLAWHLQRAPLNDIDAHREAFECSFLETDKLFTEKQITSGTTAVCALLSHTLPAHLFVAWVGDSKALLVGANSSLQLVKPHKPDAGDERKRIESCETGGTVMYVQGHWRVNGILNVSRSIGDYSVSAVIAEPDFVDVELTAAHDFLVLGTDGLWDHVAESVVSDTIYQALADAEQKIEDIPKQLIELAKQGDSQDNITVVVVFLKERLEIVANFEK